METSQNKYIQNNSQDIDDLKTRITEEIKIIRKETREFFLETINRLHFYIVVKNNTFEQYL
jgi:hypothetical protein